MTSTAVFPSLGTSGGEELLTMSPVAGDDGVYGWEGSTPDWGDTFSYTGSPGNATTPVGLLSGGIDRRMLKESVHMRIVKFLDLYFEAIILFSGILGNLLILAVFARRKVRHSSCIFIRALSITDFLILSICLTTHWINYNFNHAGKAVPVCKTILFLTTFFFDLEAWIIVSMAFERFLSVVLPFKSRVWCTPQRAGVVLGVLLGITTLKNWYITVLGGFQVNAHLGTMVCTLLYDKTLPIDRVYPWLDLAWGSALPLVLIITFNGCIIRGLGRQAELTSRHTDTNRRQRDRQVTVSLVIISLVFLLLTLPRKMFLLSYTYLPVPAPDLARTRHAMNYLLTLTVTGKLWYTNCAINIWLFSFTGSNFRRDVRQVMRCMRRNRVGPAIDSNKSRRQTGTKTTVSKISGQIGGQAGSQIREQAMPATNRTNKINPRSVHTDMLEIPGSEHEGQPGTQW